MKKRNIGFLIIGILAACCTASAQNSPGLITVVPASPNSAALGKYGEIPVSMYTGIPNITIPLYTLKGRDLEVPISLNYHAGGVRVEEIASWVGIGWSLNAGGVITRAIRGMPDDVVNGYFGNHAATLAKKYLNNISPTNSLTLDTGNAADSDLSNLESIRENIQDGQPDIYYFNFGKYSGQFFMNESGQFVVSPLQALKVEYATSSLNNGRLSRWILTTPDGVRYVFGNSMDGAKVAWENNDNPAPWGVSTTGWYLVEIYSPHNDKISLNYTNISYSYSSRGSEVLNQIVQQTIDPPTGLPTHDKNITTNDMTVPRLTSISSANGTINFGAGADRTDLPGEKPLSIINIFSNQDLANPLKKWQFYCDYSTNRLTLDSLHEYSADGAASGQSYTFSYNGSLPNPDPNGIAINSQDLWGYYNGVTNSVFPQGFTTPTPTLGQVTIQGADRHSDSTYMKYGTLYKITYPTGGYSQFDYETNQVFTSVADNSIPAPGVPEEAGSTAYFYNTSFSDTFTIVYPNPATGTVAVTATAISMLHTCPFDGSGFSQCYYANLKGINGTPYPLTDFRDGESSFALLPGTYVISGTGAGLSGQTGNVYRFFMDWSEYPPGSTDSNQMVNKAVGGLRVKRITNFDGFSTNVTRYVYNKFNDTASSGVLVNEPYNYANVFYQDDITCFDGGSIIGSTEYLQVRGYPLIPLMPTQGAAIGYQHVTKLSGENGENGKEEFTYTTANDFPDELQAFRPYAPSCSFDWRRGQLLQSTTYKNSGAGFTPIQKTSNKYINGIKSTIGYGIVVESDAQHIGNSCGTVSPTPNEYFVGSFRTVSEFQYLQSDTSWVYDQNNPSSYIQTIHNYTYDTVQGHYQLTSTITRDSKNQVEETDYRRPKDLTLTGYEETARDSLISQFILLPVLDTKTIRNGIQTLDTKNNYKVFGNGLPLPESIDQQVSAYPLERRVEFLRYDNYGNLTQQHKVSDELNTYIWNYNQSYPVASVLNGDSADVAYSSFEADANGNWAIGTGVPDSTTSITGRKSYNLNGSISKSGLNTSTTYIVSYWSQTGALTIAGTLSGYPVKAKTVSYNNPGWTLYLHKVTGQSTITLTGTGHIDELRLYPIAAQMTTYTYNPLVGLTSQCDANNRITYYEYDGLQRLKRIRDQDYNILKTYEYQYQASSGCGANCFIEPMQTFSGSNTLSYPVGVFNANGKLLGNVSNQAAYVIKWNSDTADQHRGTLAAGADSMHFQLTLNTGKTLPTLTGCRYYQYDFPYNHLDGVRNGNGVYVDFGDGTGMKLGKNPADTPAVIPANTSYNLLNSTDYYHNNDDGVTHIGTPTLYVIHNYTDTTSKPITFYHNDATEFTGLDNLSDPATGLTKVKNFRGNIPLNINSFRESSYQQSSALTVSSIANWNSIHTIQHFQLSSGDGGISPTLNTGYAQDFMQNNAGLQEIELTGCSDTSFRISRLKTNWNTWFTNITRIEISDAQWNNEDLSALKNLWFIKFFGTKSNGSAVIDSIINQVGAGAGHNVKYGVINITYPGYDKTNASNAGYIQLKSNYWVISINGVLE